MALAATVTGAGKAISGGTEIGSYSQVIKSGTTQDNKPDKLLTVFYRDIRSETKWYALTKGAIDDYISAHPEANVAYALTNDNSPIPAYEMTVTSLSRTVTGYSLTTISEET